MTERLLTARELAEYLGLSPATILDWFEADRLPGFKLGGRAVRFRASEVEAWLEGQRRGPGPRQLDERERGGVVSAVRSGAD